MTLHIVFNVLSDIFHSYRVNVNYVKQNMEKIVFNVIKQDAQNKFLQFAEMVQGFKDLNRVMMVTSMISMVVIPSVLLNRITSVYWLINCHQVLPCASTPKTSPSVC